MKYSGTQKGFSNHQYFRSFYYTAWRVMIFLRFYLAILLLNAVIMIEQDSSRYMNWTKCILCQETTAEPLQCPENIWRSDIEFGIIQFNELGSLPISIDIERLDEGSGIAPTLIEHKARWHKTCKNKFSTLKLQRIEKRKTQED